MQSSDRCSCPVCRGKHPDKNPPPAILAGEHRLPFKLRDGLIYIQAQVNGNRATLLVDSGAALTAFNVQGIMGYVDIYSSKGKLLGASSMVTGSMRPGE